MRVNTFAFALMAIVASSQVVRCASVDLLNQPLTDTINLDPEVDSVQQILNLETRGSLRRAADRHPHPHPHPHPHSHPQPPSNGNGGNDGNGSNGTVEPQAPCMYDSQSGYLTAVTQDGCPSQIMPGNQGCLLNGSDALISASILQCSLVSILSGNDRSSTQPQACNVPGANGGLISVQALECSTLDSLSILNYKQE